MSKYIDIDVFIKCLVTAFNKSADNDYDFDMDTPFCPWCGAKMDG